MRFAIVGTGSISHRHAEAVRALGERTQLVAVVSRDRRRAGEWAHRYGVRPFADIAAAVREARVDAVVVCTETGTHAAYAIEAMRAGAHVLIEKPADVRVDRIDELIAAQRASGVTVGVVSQHRFDVASERMLSAIRDGRLGTLTSAVASLALWRDQDYYDSGAWRGTRDFDGGGALMNQGVHVVDLLLAALGPAAEVSGYTATRAHERIEVEDVAVASIRFASGVLAVLHASTAAHPGGEVLLQVHGDRGTAVIRNDRLEHLGTAAVTEIEDTDDALERQYADYVGAVREGVRPRVGLDDSRAAVALISAVYESAATGRPVVLAS